MRFEHPYSGSGIAFTVVGQLERAVLLFSSLETELVYKTYISNCDEYRPKSICGTFSPKFWQCDAVLKNGMYSVQSKDYHWRRTVKFNLF